MQQDAMQQDDADDSAAAEAAQAAGNSYYTRIAPALAASGGGRQLALAAFLLETATAPPTQASGSEVGDAPSQPVARDPRIATWRARALAATGSDTLTVASLMSADPQLRLQAAARWRSAEPDNLAPILFAGGDAETLLREATQAQRFDLHMYDQVRWMQKAFAAHPPTSAERGALSGSGDVPVDEFATISAMSLWSGAGIPNMKTMFDACATRALEALPARRQPCRQIAVILVDHSDTVLGQIAGYRLLDLTASSADEHADAAARRRAFDWRMLQWGEAARNSERDGTPQFARLLRDPSVHTEQDLIARVLTEAGIALEPPPDWQPPARR